MPLPQVSPNIGRALLDVPMGDMIQEMAMAIADAQIRLDENSIEVAEMMGGLKTITDDNGNVTFEDSRVFFGTREITIGDAIAISNTTVASDPEQHAKVRQAIEDLPDSIVTGDGAAVAFNAPDESVVVRIPTRVSMLELGFAPTFYQFVDTIIEVKISIKYTQEASSSSSVSVKRTSKNRSFSGSFSFKRGFRARRNVNVNTTQVNAKHSQKYSYTAEGSSLLRTKLVPIPPPAILEERIRDILENDDVAEPSE